jgi:hypothetical protein
MLKILEELPTIYNHLNDIEDDKNNQHNYRNDTICI